MIDLVNAVATVLFTYAAHSAVACLVVLALCLVLRRPQERDLLWKAALVLPVITSATVMLSAQAGAARMRLDLARMARHSGLLSLPGRKVMVHVTQTGSERVVLREMTGPVTAALSIAVVLVALCCIAVAVSRFVHRRRLLTNALAHRRQVDRIGNGAISLSVAPELPSPVALHGSEICLPAVVMHEFPEPHRDTLVAHEMAHIERRDPFWFSVVDVVTTLSAFQPLVFVVARAFRRDVELICDEAAVRRTNDRQSLIGALALLASPFDARLSIQGAPTAYDGSPLVARATRIASLCDPRDETRRQAFLAVAALALALVFLPVVSSAPRLEDIGRDLPAMVRHLAGTDSVRVEMRSRVLVTSADCCNATVTHSR